MISFEESTHLLFDFYYLYLRTLSLGRNLPSTFCEERNFFFFFGVDFVVSWLIDFGGRFHSPPCLTVAFPKYFLAKPTNRIFWNTCVTERIVCFCLSYSIDLLLQEFLLYFGNPSANGINGFSLGEFHWEPRDNILGFVFLG